MTNDYCFASYYVTEKCNFDCTYCYIYHPTGLKRILRRAKKVLKPRHTSSSKHELYRELDTVIQNFLKTGKKVTLGFTGGEPLVYPHFIDICKRLISYDNFRIALDTNLSVNMNRFIEAVPPEKTEYIFASMHILERERIYGSIDSFLDAVIQLKNKGYSVDVNYVMYPPLFDRIERDYKYCLDRGVRLTLTNFTGIYENKVYPKSYTSTQRAVMQEYLTASQREECASRNFNGRRCNAGKSIIRIKTNGDITRCVGDQSLLGNIFTGFTLHEIAQPCMLETCPCFSTDRLFDDPWTEPAAPLRMSLAAKLKQKLIKLKGWWETD